MLCKSGVGRCRLPVSGGCLIPTCFVCCSVAHKTYFVNRLYAFLKTRIDRSPSKRVFLHMLFRRERKPLSHHSRLKRHRRRLRKKPAGSRFWIPPVFLTGSIIRSPPDVRPSAPGSDRTAEAAPGSPYPWIRLPIMTLSFSSACPCTAEATMGHTVETIKGYQNKEIEPPGGEQCSRPVAL